MMRAFMVVGWALAAAACANDVTPPDPGDELRTVLFYREDTGRNMLLNSDGTNERIVAFADSGLVPLGVSIPGNEVAFLDGGALVIVNLNDPNQYDTLMPSIPPSISPVGFSPDGAFVALFQYEPVAQLLVLDRAGNVDTLPHGSSSPALPPVFSPDGQMVGLVSVTELSIVLTIVPRGVGPLQGGAAGFPRITYQPIFGWPAWTDAGVLVATVRREATGDTLIVVRIDPDQPAQASGPYYRVDAPSLVYDGGASYALSADGDALILAARHSPLAGRRTLYLGERGRLITTLAIDPAARPAFPLLLP